MAALSDELGTMRALTYSWIGLSAAAPLIFLMCAWVLGVFHGYRRHWRSVDLFLLAVFVQELLMALQVFAYALLSLMRPESAVACGAFVWSLSATRTLQAATVVSLLVDRMLTSQWPYKYRFSVRRHQIRYHLVVLATIAALVGVAAILARPTDAPDAFQHCSFLPHALHTRLALLMLSIYGMMLVGAVVCIVVVQGSRGCISSSSGGNRGHVQHHHHHHHHDLMATNTTSSTASSSGGGGKGSGNGVIRGSGLLTTTASTTSTTSSTTSSNALGAGGGQMFSSTSDLVPPPLPPGPPHGGRIQKSVGGMGSGPIGRPGAPLPRNPEADFRWGTTLAVAALCFLVNHLPYVAMTIIGTFNPDWVYGWPLENMSLWLSLAEGLFLPLLLGLVDPTFSHHAGASCCSSRCPQDDVAPINNHHKYEDGVGPFRMFPRDEVKSFPLTNGSLFSSLLNMNMDNPQHQPHNQGHNYRRGMIGGGLKMGITAGEVRGLVRSVSNQLGPRYSPPSPPYGPPYYVRDQTESLRTESMASVATSSQDPIYSDPLALKLGSTDSSLKDDHIYATLSETFGSLSSLSDGYLADDNRCSSVTTVANDDFEFRTSCMPDPTQYPDRRDLATIDSRHLTTSNVSAKNVVLANRPPAKLPPEARKHDDDLYKLSTNTLSTSSSSPSSSFRSGSSQVTATIENNELNQNEIINEDLDKSPEIGHFNKAFECDTLEKKRKYFQESLDSLHEIEEKKKEGTLSRKHRSSSLSMNDLDSLTTDTEKEEEMMFILPVKSESMLSLYRLYLAEDEENNTNLHYSMEVSKSEGDLSVLSSSTNSVLGEGKSEGALHEVYQKRRIPEVVGSRIKRQHKIQRAKGLQQRSKISSAPTSSITNIHETDNGSLQVTVTDKSRRRNGIITIRDPSVLSVDELFKVLERATTKQTMTYANDQTETPSIGEGEFKKIFVSEYI
ncbi:unnamed protein product [Meganyctiphanes norvegica]|uniref:G-protein coupled receptors family 1 profile domain-containing protein n=1 Tax=Meganyctiphanes norvegica TaxID=48144 RepID=A0AAV2R376_MEGNR